MTTLGDMVNEVHLSLLGYTGDQEQITSTTGFDAVVLSFTVVDASQISTGLIEVDEELLWCTQVDPDANIVYVSIRGMYGSTAVVHASGAVVRNAPRYPRVTIVNALNDLIQTTYPDLFVVSSTQITVLGAAVTYELPVDVEDVLDVTYELRDPSGYWYPLHRWSVDLDANVTAYPSGKTLSVFESVASNRTLQVTYKRAPTALSLLSDNITASGLRASAKTCLVYGACARLVGYLEPARLSDESAEAKFMSTQTAGSAINASRYFYQMFLQARAEENRRLLDRYPPRIHWNR